MTRNSFLNRKRLWSSIREFLTLERQVLVLFIAALLISLGEELWSQYLPKYFLALGGTAVLLGIFKSFSDLLETLSQLPGGIVSDRLGRIFASIVFFTLGIFGYFIYLISNSWLLLFLGIIFVQGTSSLLQPTIFSIIGDRMPVGKRTNAFSVQSILKRLPIVISPIIGGFLIETQGIVFGVRVGLAFTISFAIIGMVLIWYSGRTLPEHEPQVLDEKSTKLKNNQINDDNINKETDIYGDNYLTETKKLSFLLVSDILARFGQAMVKFFIVIYVIDLAGAQILGLLVALQMTVSIISYLPAAGIVSKVGRKPVIAVTFACFFLYPSLILTATNVFLLIIGFFVAGMKEFGEPARKALIVNLTSTESRGQKIGLYYTIRSLMIIPAGFIGGLLWTVSPILTALTASFVALIGLINFIIFVHE